MVVERVEGGAKAGGGGRGVGGNAAGGGKWLWWMDGRCATVEKLMGQMRGKLSPVGGGAKQLVGAIRSLAKQVAHGGAAGGVLFVQSGALAGCFANRCASLRAVVGTCGEAAMQGVNLLGANVLIVEYPHHGVESMRGMIEDFVGAERGRLDGVARQLEELGTCV